MAMVRCSIQGLQRWVPALGFDHAGADFAGTTPGVTRRAASPSMLLCRFRELVNLLVAALDRVVERCLGVFLATPDGLKLLIDDVADLHEVAQANASRLVRGLDDHLLHGHVRPRILVVE